MKSILTTALVFLSLNVQAKIDTHQGITKLPEGVKITTTKPLSIQPNEEMFIYNMLEYSDRSLADSNYSDHLIGRVVCTFFAKKSASERVLKKNAEYTIESAELAQDPQPVKFVNMSGVMLPQIITHWIVKFKGKGTIEHLIMTKESSAIVTPPRGTDISRECGRDWHGNKCQSWISEKSMSYFRISDAMGNLNEPTIDDLEKCIKDFAQVEYPEAVEVDR